MTLVDCDRDIAFYFYATIYEIYDILRFLYLIYTKPGHDADRHRAYVHSTVYARKIFKVTCS